MSAGWVLHFDGGAARERGCGGSGAGVRGLIVRLGRAVLCGLLLTLGGMGRAQAQWAEIPAFEGDPFPKAADSTGEAASRAWASSEDARAARIVKVYGREQLLVGEYEHFWVELGPGTERPSIFRWAMGDGTFAAGNYITHRYLKPGRYPVTVYARNRLGYALDTAWVMVTQVEPGMLEVIPTRSASVTASSGEPETKPSVEARPRSSASAPPAGIHGAEIEWAWGGYTLIMATFLDNTEAERAALRYRRAGYRTGIVTDTSGRGSTAYRVVVGQFATPEAAVAGRQAMLRRGHTEAVLVHPLPGGK